MSKIIHAFVNTFLHNPNQFASGGLLLMALGSAVAMLKSLPGKAWSHIVDQCTVSLVLTDDSPEIFYNTRRWLQAQSFMARARHLDVVGRSGGIVNPAPGRNQYMWHNKRLFQILITRSEKKDSPEGYSNSKRSESIHIRTIGRDKRLFRNLVDTIWDFNKETPQPKLYIWSNDMWEEIHPYLPRPLDSVILAPGMKERIVKDIELFRASEAWYKNMGIPYRRGYLLEGPPGTGKTSLAAGLSAHFNANVSYLKLSGLTDDKLRASVSQVGADAFIVMEDVDTISVTHDREKAAKGKGKKKELIGVTLSGLLNVLDGMLAPKGAVFIMTTNHVDTLDSALIRPGRVDMRLHIAEATPEQKRALYQRFYPGGDMPEKYNKNEFTMAGLQQALMDERNRRVDNERIQDSTSISGEGNKREEEYPGRRANSTFAYRPGVGLVPDRARG